MHLASTFLPVTQVDTGDSLLKAGTTALHYANNDRHNASCFISNWAFVCLIYVASGSVFSIWCNFYEVMMYREWKREETKNTDEIVQKFIDGTKQIKRNQEA
ncbi:hypothetical protein T4B_2871, partial [Trichinella pseudospiralis]